MRTFIAVELPGGLKNHLAHLMTELSARQLKAKWVAPANLHVTLKFLGDVADRQLEDLIVALNLWGRKIHPFQVKLTRLGFFPVRGTPRVLFAGLDQQDRLGKMAEELDLCLERLGFPREEHFKGHVTLARFKEKNRRSVVEEKLQKIDVNGEFRLGAVGLYQSTLTAGGPIYQQLYRLVLGGPSSEGPLDHDVL
ncbi:MAG: RNA 2',3'-cyclic phosphodiesterase [Desulfuromonadales bacterium]|nr:RNA 2',3'-cyclic phosphodiesterase [Desulfuromonadales bacterium]MBN2793308.1 RNA 2',3'-cyclic phosphodiesterase [Desulfuromonadales bacterium]